MARSVQSDPLGNNMQTAFSIFGTKLGSTRRRRLTGCWLALGLVPASVLLSIPEAAAADSPAAESRARYVKERAACLSGASNQNRAVCLEEAGAALQASQRAGLDDSTPNQQAQNNLSRCDALPAGDRTDCIRRMRGEGVTSGSAADGGIYREITSPITPQPVN